MLYQQLQFTRYLPSETVHNNWKTLHADIVVNRIAKNVFKGLFEAKMKIMTISQIKWISSK